MSFIFLDYTIVSFIIQNVHLRYSKSLPLVVPQLPSSPHLEAVLQFSCIFFQRWFIYMSRKIYVVSLFIQMIECYILSSPFLAFLSMQEHVLSYYVAEHQEFPILPL